MPENLPWYERDGIMTWYDRAKCRNFLENSKKHFEEVEVVNFDIIHRSARGEPVPAETCQTIQNKRVKQYPKKDKKRNFI